jgi:YD repeat-containing protein
MFLSRQKTLGGGDCHQVRAALAAVVTLLAFMTSAYAQGGTTRYVYDNNGRLRAVIAPNGEANIYEYDAAGNITAIRRLTDNDLEIIEFTPREGAVGTQVTISGVGFGGTVGSAAFNGVPAPIISQTETSIIAAVPVGATTGIISITSPRGTRTTTEPFTVKGVGIVPDAVTVSSGRALQFMAFVTGLPDPGVIWSVDDVVGGNNTVGTITTNGLYTAPNIPNPPDGQFIVRATSSIDPAMFGEAQVIVPSQGSGYDAISRGVSVRYGTPTSPSNVPAFAVNNVSVRYGTPTPPVSVPSQVYGAVSVAKGPVITAVTPGNIPRDAILTVTFSGANLSGANNLKFANEDGTQEIHITASNINVNLNGTELTATVTVNAGTTVGLRIVFVTTPAGTSLAANSGTNTVQVVQ